ncbi:CPBP family intramembrane glutamic endopeptidase [Ruminococcus sp.]|jgi:membrane protease YdiL (CAAX protease family)|uniref:CPBP family intramembrane glutamic endopeptidase n=1 Tax=Ruminococcus sp. TaxID=41978 RepID=UPI0025E78A92|nr:CPBP family intramembrane glutamic endopeptidase [Ruminococcus sp.]
METTTKSRKLKITLLVYIIIFYGIWTLYTFLVSPFLEDHFQNAAVCQIIKECIKNLVWTLPAMLLVHHFSSEVHIQLKEMFTTKVKWLHYLPIFAFFTVDVLITRYRMDHSLKLIPDLSADKVIMLLSVGITEEMVFRGWLLNATVSSDKKKQWQAIALNAVMFMLIHFPTWIRHDTFVSVFTGFGFIEILALGVIFSLSFLKSRNIFVPILLHMYWDLIV